jgi:hypothetical protein
MSWFSKIANSSFGRKIGNAIRKYGTKDNMNIAKNSYNDWSTGQYHFPGYNFMGPGTKNLQKVHAGVLPSNRTDGSAMRHDNEYDRIQDHMKRGTMSEKQINKAIRKSDRKFINELNSNGERKLIGNQMGRQLINLKNVAEDWNFIRPSRFVDT